MHVCPCSSYCSVVCIFLVVSYPFKPLEWILSNLKELNCTDNSPNTLDICQTSHVPVALQPPFYSYWLTLCPFLLQHSYLWGFSCAEFRRRTDTRPLLVSILREDWLPPQLLYFVLLHFRMVVLEYSSFCVYRDLSSLHQRKCSTSQKGKSIC